MVPIPRARLGMGLSFFAVALVAGIHARPAAAQGSCSEVKLTASDAGCGDQFGVVGLDGDTLVVGAAQDDHAFPDAGSAYVFRRSGGKWIEQQKLVAPDAYADDLFGWAVALERETLLVAAAYHPHGLPRAGAVYAFQWNGSTWVFEQELLPSDPKPLGQFGIAVALRGDVAAIGAVHETFGGGDESGAVYVFRRSSGVWTQQQKLRASDAAPWQAFGGAIALEDEFLFSSGGGAIYLFHWTGSSWVEVQKLTASDSASGGYLSTVAVRGDWLISGSPSQDDPLVNSGAAYIFHREGGAWVQRQKLFPSDPTLDGYFGRSVVIGSTVAMLGASISASGSPVGVMFAFRREGDQWVETRILRGPEGYPDDFGGVASLSNCTLAVGARGDTGTCLPADPPEYQGSASVYEIQGCLPCIPTLSTWGALVLALLLIGFGTILAARRATVARTLQAGGMEKRESKMSAQSKAVLMGALWVFSEVLGGGELGPLFPARLWTTGGAPMFL